jgi:hypothetical protein
MNRDGGDIELAPQSAFVQRLDVLEAMFKAIPAEIDFVLRHRIKHEGVIRIGRMPEGKNA